MVASPLTKEGILSQIGGLSLLKVLDVREVGVSFNARDLERLAAVLPCIEALGARVTDSRPEGGRRGVDHIQLERMEEAFRSYCLGHVQPLKRVKFLCGFPMSARGCGASGERLVTATHK